MMNFIEKVGNIKVYTEMNTEKDFFVILFKGNDEILRERYYTEDYMEAIEDILERIGIFTENNILYDCFADGTLDYLEKLSENTYKLNWIGEKNDFIPIHIKYDRIDNTKYFQSFVGESKGVDNNK